MNSLVYIDLYCERTGPEFWNEPLNALTNIAFVIAAIIAWRSAQHRGGMDAAEGIVILLAGSIGFGSFAFHTLANSWAELSDVIPIWSFVAAFVALTIYRSTGQEISRTLRILGIVVLVIVGISWFTAGDITTETHTAPDRLNGSLQYLPAVIALGVFATLSVLRDHPGRNYIVGAFLVFICSLVFRTIDLETCAATGIGTHFLWHILNAVMIGLLLQALVRHMPPLKT